MSCLDLQFRKTQYHPQSKGGVSCGSRLKHVPRWNDPCSGACSKVQPKDNEMKVVAIILKWVQFLQGKKKQRSLWLLAAAAGTKQQVEYLGIK